MWEQFNKIIVAFNYLLRVLGILITGGKIKLVFIVLVTIAFGFMPGISILVMQEIINTLQTSIDNFNYLLLLIAIYIGIDVFKGIAGMCSGYLERVLLMKAEITLNLSVLKKVKELSLRNFEDSETYNLIQRAVRINISTLYSFFKSFVMIVQSLISLIMFSLILLSWHSWLLPIIFIMPIIQSLVTAYFGKKQFLIQKERAGEGRKQWYYQFLLTNDIAFKEIKTFNLGDYFRSKYREISLKFLKQDRKILNQTTFVQALVFVADQMIVAALYVFIIFQAFTMQILLGNLVAYTRSIANIKGSTQGFLSQLNSIYQDILNISLYFDFVDMKGETDKQFDTEKHVTIPYIEINNLSYKYKNKTNYALSNLNLRIEKNTLVAFIGGNGSGKTTLVKILSAIYDDYEGNVYFGEQNLNDLNPDNIRKKIGILFQDFVKYELTARENVSLGQLDKIDDDYAISQVLSKTGMRDKIENIESQLGFWFDDGVQLSGGEWLRIALSRAFIRDADLYLLDEPNSALDPISENQILNSFKELAKGKIGIIISHRIASIKNIVDTIVVFDKGTIQACGTHDELLVNSDVYRRLYQQEEGLI